MAILYDEYEAELVSTHFQDAVHSYNYSVHHILGYEPVDVSVTKSSDIKAAKLVIKSVYLR